LFLAQKQENSNGGANGHKTNLIHAHILRVRGLTMKCTVVFLLHRPTFREQDRPRPFLFQQPLEMDSPPSVGHRTPIISSGGSRKALAVPYISNNQYVHEPHHPDHLHSHKVQQKQTSV